MAQTFRQDPSATTSFKIIRDARPIMSSAEPAKAVVLGGGTGAPTSIQTLLSLGVETSAVVAMADDGGSTGILREKAGVTPPGDIRKCLAAMALDPEDPLTKAFKYRMDIAQNHTLGNLMLSALENATGSFPQAIKICEQLLNVKGHVYPSTLSPVTLCGRTRDGQVIYGQARLSHSNTALEKVWLKSERIVEPYPGAIKAICEADLIVLGPGSLFTSIIPNILVPGIVEAIRASHGKVMFVCGLADVQGETWGLSVEEHVGALLDHGMEGLIDFVLAHTPMPLRPGGTHAGNFAAVVEGPSAATAPADRLAGSNDVRSVPISYDSVHRIQQRGPQVIARNLVDPQNPTWHYPVAMRSAFTEVLKLCRSPHR